MSNELLQPEATTRSNTKNNRRSSAEAKALELDARRKLEERLEDMRLEREIVEFDFDYA